MSGDIEYRIAKLVLKAGDVLVAKYDGFVSHEMLKRAMAELRGGAPDGVKIIMVDKQIDISVLTFEEIQSRVRTPESA